MTATRLWQDLPWPAFRDLPRHTIALLPVASTEQHGPHLPLSVDTVIGEGVVQATLARLPADLPLLVLPTVKVALAAEHLRYPGSLTLSAETLLALVGDIGASVARAGIDRLVIINSHGGNIPVLETAAFRIRLAHRILVLNTAWPRHGRPAALHDPVEAAFGIHAGRDETALMLALSPASVRMESARDFTSRLMALPPALRAMPPGWQAQDLHPAGAVGNAATATPAMGQALLDHAAARLADLFTQLAAFDVAAWLREDEA